MLRTMKMLAFAAVAAGALSFGTVAASAQSTTLENAQKRGTLRIATIGSNQPFTTVNVNGEPEGYDVDIGKMIAAALKLKPEFVMTDSAGRIAALQTGKADLTIASFTRTVERSEVIAFTDPYVIVGLQFLVRADRKDLNTFDDLKKPGIKFGVDRGGTAEDNVGRLIKDAELVKFSNPSDGLPALDSGQIDVYPNDSLVAQDIVKSNPKEYKVIPGTYTYEELAIGLPAGDFDWWRILNAWVRQFNASGENAALFKKWFGYEMPVALK